MPLVDDLTDALSQKRECKLMRLGLSDEESEAVATYVSAIRSDQDRAEKLFTVAELHRILLKNGYSIGKTSVSEHVRKVCACEQP